MKGNVVDMAVGVIIGAAFARSCPRWWVTSSCRRWATCFPASVSATLLSTSARARTASRSCSSRRVPADAVRLVIIAFVLFMALKGINRLRSRPRMRRHRRRRAMKCCSRKSATCSEEMIPETCVLDGRRVSAAVGKSGAREVVVAAGGHDNIVLDADAAAAGERFHQRPVDCIGMRPARNDASRVSMK